MITKWKDLKEVVEVHYGAFGIVLVMEDDFAVVTAEVDRDWTAHALLAREDNLDAIGSAEHADAPGAKALWDTLRAKQAIAHREQELRRLAFLTKKYLNAKEMNDA